MRSQPFRSLLLAVVPLAALATGCTYSIHAREPVFGTPAADKLPVQAAIIISDEASRTKVPVQNFWVGIVHRWELQTGEGLEVYSRAYFDRLFRFARVVRDRTHVMGDAAYGILIEPQLYDVEVSQDFVTTLALRCSIKDRNDRVLYDATFEGRTRDSGAFTKACLGGVFTGQSAFEDSFSAALDDAFGQLTRDLTSPANRQKLLPAVRSAGTGTQ